MNVWLTQVSLFLSNQCVQVSEDLCVIDGTVDGLSPGLHGLNIHELGDLSQGCSRLEYYSLRKQPIFAMPPPVSPQNDVQGRSTEIQY